jgi:hypothetical protein
MLTKTKGIYHGPSPQQDGPAPTISGHDLLILVRRLSPRQRATLAKELATGRRQLSKLTRRQAAAICGVSLPLVDEAVRNNTAVKPPVDTPTVSAWWRDAPFTERVDLIRSFGAADTWDALAKVVA